MRQGGWQHRCWRSRRAIRGALRGLGFKGSLQHPSDVGCCDATRPFRVLATDEAGVLAVDRHWIPVGCCRAGSGYVEDCRQSVVQSGWRDDTARTLRTIWAISVDNRSRRDSRSAWSCQRARNRSRKVHTQQTAGRWKPDPQVARGTGHPRISGAPVPHRTRIHTA
jgi:hypothetical protein